MKNNIPRSHLIVGKVFLGISSFFLLMAVVNIFISTDLDKWMCSVAFFLMAFSLMMLSVLFLTGGAIKLEKYHFAKKNAHLSIINADCLDGPGFEQYCADLLKKSGFLFVKITPSSGDQGVDIIAYKKGVKYAFQCKHRSDPYGRKVGNTPVQEVHAGKEYYHCQYAVAITNGYYTDNARQLAFATHVELWDRDKLIDMIRQILQKN